MKKTLIAIAVASLFYVSDAMAQTAPATGKRTRMAQDSTHRRGDRAGHNFREMEKLTAKDLPASTTSFIKSKYPNAEMKRIAKSKDNQYFVVLTETDKPRHMLIADSKGNILKDREMPAHKGGRHSDKKQS